MSPGGLTPYLGLNLSHLSPALPHAYGPRDSSCNLSSPMSLSATSAASSTQPSGCIAIEPLSWASLRVRLGCRVSGCECDPGATRNEAVS
jgi:hypothetical protein